MLMVDRRRKRAPACFLKWSMLRYGSWVPTWSTFASPHSADSAVCRSIRTWRKRCKELDHRKVAYVHLIYQFLPSGNMTESEFNEAYLSAFLLQRIRETFGGTNHLVWRIYKGHGSGSFGYGFGRLDCFRQTLRCESGSSGTLPKRLAAGRGGSICLLHQGWREGLYRLLDFHSPF
jgi:hypothetical protein